MKKLMINRSLSGAFPEGFHEMDRHELIKYFAGDTDRCGIHDENRHVILSVSWSKPGFLGFLTDERSVLNGARLRLKLHLQRYRRLEKLNREIASRPAVGIRFEYQVTGTEFMQYSDLYVFKLGKLIYAVQLVARKECFEESQLLSEEFLRSIAVPA